MTQIKTTEILFRGTRMRCMANQLSVKVAASKAADTKAAELALRSALGPDVAFRFVFPFDENGIACIEIDSHTALEAVADRIERSSDILRAQSGYCRRTIKAAANRLAKYVCPTCSGVAEFGD